MTEEEKIAQAVSEGYPDVDETCPQCQTVFKNYHHFLRCDVAGCPMRGSGPSVLEQLLLPPMYVVYDHPKDHPEYYVVRRWVGETADDRFFMQSRHLDCIREMLVSMRLTPLARKDGDDPVIVETWL